MALCVTYYKTDFTNRLTPHLPFLLGDPTTMVALPLVLYSLTFLLKSQQSTSSATAGTSII